MQVVTMTLARLQEEGGSRYYFLLRGVDPAGRKHLACRGLQLLDSPDTLLALGAKDGLAVYIKKHDQSDPDFCESFELEGQKITVGRGYTIHETARIIWEEVDELKCEGKLSEWFKGQAFAIERVVLPELEDWDAALEFMWAIGLQV